MILTTYSQTISATIHECYGYIQQQSRHLQFLKIVTHNMFGSQKEEDLMRKQLRLSFASSVVVILHVVCTGPSRASSGPGVIYEDRPYGGFGGVAPKKIFSDHAL